jgi:hypothetical protein
VRSRLAVAGHRSVRVGIDRRMHQVQAVKQFV